MAPRPTRTQSSRRTDLFCVLLLLVLPFIFFWPAAIRQGAFFVGDVFRLYLPQRAVLASALRAGRLPLWSPDVLAGYPIFAEGEMGALYPLNVLLYLLLPLDLALDYSVILHFALAGLATYAFGRALRLRPAASLLGALVFTWSGFAVGHVNHLSIIAAFPWLPAILAFIEWQAAPSRTRIAPWAQVILTGMIFALQFLAGHPQIALMMVLVSLAYAAVRLWPLRSRLESELLAVRGNDFGRPWLHKLPIGRIKSPLRTLSGPAFRVGLLNFLPTLAGLILGTMLAAPQLLSTYELTRLSERAGGLTGSFFTSFSWHPALLATLVWPFLLGNPYPTVSVELAAYLGILPWLLAAATLLMRRDRVTLFFAGAGLIGLLLSFGEWNPLYPWLARVPVLNYFRVPARFWYVITMAVAVLAGVGADGLLARLERLNARRPLTASHRTVLCSLFSVLMALLSLIFANLMPSADALVSAWRLLPLLWIGGSLALVGLAWRGRMSAPDFAWLSVGLLLADLYAYSAVYGRTYNAVMDLSTFYARPRTLDLLPAEALPYRVYTHEAIVPALSVQRESFYPNIGMLYGVPGVGGYFPLRPRRHVAYLEELTPRRLNLLNVRYVIIPQLLPVDEESEFYDVENPFAPTLVERAVSVPPTETVALEVSSYTSHSADWPQGTPVADLVLTGADGTQVTFTLRAGMETAEWAYDRDDVREKVAHARPPVASTWPASSGFPPREHPGHSYLARFELAQPLKVVGVEVRPHRPLAYVRVEGVILIGPGGERWSLRRLLDEGEHALVYRSQDAVVYENPDALPRAFVVYRSRLVPDDEAALALLDDPAFDPWNEVLLASGAPIFGPETGGPAHITELEPERVVIEVDAVAPGYVVLLDSYYPGWLAWVDGQPAPIRRANVLFRAVPVTPGHHTIEMRYAPRSLALGARVSLAAVFAVGLVLVLGPVLQRRRPGCSGRQDQISV